MIVLRSFPLTSRVGAGLIVLALGAGTPLAAQIPLGRSEVNHAPRLLVTNPAIDRPADSTTSITLGEAIRQRMNRVVGEHFRIVTRKEMNEALASYGMNPDQIVSAVVARSFATSLVARTMLTSALTRGDGGRLKLVARLAGLSDDAGNTVRVTQAEGQNLESFGSAVADGFSAAIRARDDAKSCADKLQMTPPDSVRAGEYARKALRTDPVNGLAHFCLAQSLKAQHAPDSAWVGELNRAVQGDSLSLPALAQLGDYYRAHNDTANVVQKFQQMILAAPTNVALIEAASKVFRQYGRPEAAEEIANRGIALDSTDATMWDLKSSACVYQSKYSCAVAALEQVLAIDSTKGDSSFYVRLTVTASAQTDTASLVQSALKWGQVGLRKFPTNATMLGVMLSLYTGAKQWDSVVSYTGRVMALDSTDIATPQATIQALLAAKQRYDTVLGFGRRVIAKGDAQAKQNIAGLFINGAAPLLQPPQQPDTAALLMRVVFTAIDSTNQYWVIANYLNGAAVFTWVTKMDSATVAAKSCDGAKREAGMLDQAKAGLTIGLRSPTPAVATGAKTLLGYIDKYQPHVASMLKAYKCQ
ncbi:MAG: tetratricopeptide repeat protein [Gemmatimonadales bacterium]